MDVKKTISERERTHGDFTLQAHVAQTMKTVVHKTIQWDGLPPTKREAIDMILTKISRMVCGDHTEPDHALDIQGYASLIQEQPNYDTPTD